MTVVVPVRRCSAIETLVQTSRSFRVNASDRGGSISIRFVDQNCLLSMSSAMPLSTGDSCIWVCIDMNPGAMILLVSTTLSLWISPGRPTWVTSLPVTTIAPSRRILWLPAWYAMIHGARYSVVSVLNVCPSRRNVAHRSSFRSLEHDRFTLPV